MFKLTMHFKHEIIRIWQRLHRNFQLSGLRINRVQINRARPVIYMIEKENFLWAIIVKCRRELLDLHEKVKFTELPSGCFGDERSPSFCEDHLSKKETVL